MKCLRYILSLVAPVYFLSCSIDMPKDVEQAYDELPGTLDYNIDIKPILSDKCFSCHGPDKNKQKAGLRLDIQESAFGELPESPGKVAIDPFHPEESEVFNRILSPDPGYLMPTPSSHLSLSPKEKAILVKWIKDGARYKPHWAFVKPVKPDIPVIKNKSWPAINPIDNFIQERLELEGLQPSATAGKELLLRRLYLDLTGLPPTIEQIDGFLNDRSANAYEKQVDNLLGSVHYGERMAVDWLDVARFADSHGYTVDHIRDMSPYRDWVINAFNKNLSYDKFVTDQLAGDLEPNPTRDQVIATAFNRNHPQNTEGGIIEEEFQTEYVVDRTNTFGSAFLGLTVGCAKCHDHKFDPISQKSYYELFSFFNNVKEAGQISFNDDLPSPTLLLPTGQQEQLLRFINSDIKKQEQKVQSADSNSAAGFNNWVEKGDYKKLVAETVPKYGLQAYFPLDHNLLSTQTVPAASGIMDRERADPRDVPHFVKTQHGNGLQLDGDTWLHLKKTGIFRKSQPFTIGIWVTIPKELKEGVILHKCIAERLYNFKGYHLYLKDNRFELSMAHTAPSNAITKISRDTVPRDRWIQLAITYDGSSKASGLNLYLDGEQLQLQTTMDQLTKDILFSDGTQPGLQVGGWGRGLGLKSGTVDDILVYNRELTAFEIKIIAGKSAWAGIAGKKPGDWTPDERKALTNYYSSACDPVKRAALKELETVRTRLSDSTENIREIMVMQEMPEPKKTHLLKRGNYDAPGEEVFPNTPESIEPFPKNTPKNRYGLAKWLVNENNPLAARVAVNRFWQNFFGTGLVKTSEDFGNQGEMPSHPALLDWLAVTFRESGWDVKKLNKLIVMSATYRQNSYASKALRERDPDNRLLARGPVTRLSAEMIRDNALLASGLINTQVGGKSVSPYQPAGLWEINNTSYQADSGEAVYRRSMYVILKRSVPNPTLNTFDAGSRSYCVMRRQQTNTPLQALVTLNDPTFIEASKVIGEKMSEEPDSRKAITAAYRRLTGQSPGQDALTLLMDLERKELDKFRQSPVKAEGWLKTGQYVVNKNMDVSLVAARAVVASTIMNSDASLIKR